MRVAIALSVLVHGAGITWFAAREATVHLRGVLARVERAPLPTEIAVVFLDNGTSAQFGDGFAQVVPGRATSRVVAGSQSGSQPTTEVAPPKPLPAKKLSLSMRSGPDVHRPLTAGMSDEMIEQMVNGELDYRIANLPGARADAAYDRANAKLHSQHWIDGATPEQVAAAHIDRMAAREAKKDIELVARTDGTYTAEKKTFRATVNPDGTVRTVDKPNWQWKSVFHAEFDLTAGVMGSKEANASAKRAFLDRTRDQRVEIGKRYRSSQLARSAQIMTANLARLWATVTDPAERKAELFALWDECAETGDEELVEAGAEARRLVINFIRVKGVVYTAAELAALDAKKQSRARFAP